MQKCLSLIFELERGNFTTVLSGKFHPTDIDTYSLFYHSWLFLSGFTHLRLFSAGFFQSSGESAENPR